MGVVVDLRVVDVYITHLMPLFSYFGLDLLYILPYLTNMYTTIIVTAIMATIALLLINSPYNYFMVIYLSIIIIST